MAPRANGVNCAAASTQSHRSRSRNSEQREQPADTAASTASSSAPTLSRPDVKGQNGCVVKAPGASGYCPLISPPSNGKGNMVVQAVVYIPNSTFAGQVQQHRQLQDRHGADCAHPRHRHQPEPRRNAGHRRGHAASHQRRRRVHRADRRPGVDEHAGRVPRAAEQRNRRPRHQVLGHQEVTDDIEATEGNDTMSLSTINIAPIEHFLRAMTAPARPTSC